MRKRIIYNAIRTPDGTVLESSHVHDYRTHIDKNGKKYMVDGGTEYIRRNLHDDYEELSIIDEGDLDHKVVREYFKWGTRGPKGDQPLTYKPIKDLDTDHIIAILRDGYKRVEKYMKDELDWRVKHGL